MAFGIVHYDATLAAVHPDRSTLPKGQLYHAAGESDGGWTVIAIHDSQQSQEEFLDDILMPRLSKGIQGGFTTPPQEQSFEIYYEKQIRRGADREASL